MRTITPFFIVLALLAASCQQSPTPAPVGLPSPFSGQLEPSATLPATPQPTATVTPSQTPTLPPTPTATFTPADTATSTPDPAGLMDEAAPLCQAAFESAVQAATPSKPFLILARGSDADAEWTRLQLYQHGLEAASADRVSTLVCIRQTTIQMTTYTDGQPGYRQDWDVRLVSWPQGVPIAEVSLRGGNPPDVKFGSDAAYGASPSTQLFEWLLETLGDHSILNIGKAVSEVAFSPDGTLLAIAETTRVSDSWSGVFQSGVRLVEVATGEVLTTLSGHTAVEMAVRVTSLAFSPDGKLLASGGSDTTVILWDVASRSILRRVLSGSAPASLGIRDITFSPDGTAMAVVDWSGFLSMWDPATGQELPGFEAFAGASHNVYEVSFSPDGQTLAAASSDGQVVLLDAATGQVIDQFAGSEDPVISLAFSPDGTQIAAGRRDSTLQLWDASGGQVLFTLVGHNEQVNSVAYSPDGTRLASGSSDGRVIVWDTASGTALGLLEGHSRLVWTVAFSPDGAWVASGSEDESVKLWKLADYLTLSPEAVATQLAPTASPTMEPAIIELEGAQWRLEVTTTDEGDTQTIHITFVPLSDRSLLEWIPQAPDSFVFLNGIMLIGAEGDPYFASPDFDVSTDAVPTVTLHFEAVPKGENDFMLSVPGALPAFLEW